MSDDGATPAADNRGGECMGRWKHAWSWMPGNSTSQRCHTCGDTRVVKLGMGLSPNSGQAQPSDDEIVIGLAAQFKCPEAVALSWLAGMFTHFNQREAAERLAERQHDASKGSTKAGVQQITDDQFRARSKSA